MSSPAAFVFIVICVFIQAESITFSTSKECIDDVVRQVKEKRMDLATEFTLSNQQSSESLLKICEYYVPHKVHKVLRLVNEQNCSNAEIPSTTELEKSIYDSYVQLLKQLIIYEGSTNIPNSFGQLNDHVIGMNKGIFDRTTDRLAGQCLHKSAAEIE